ncbi:MAG TPA: NADH-quinone oxidoreductase subunit A [Gemmatimonadales bacterium]|nr:NADH-quinone oxidoreductase subunit A [Gemmatimonadales bacterium]
MLESYVPLALLIGFVVFNAVAMVAVSHVLSATRPTPVKHQPYESGMPPLGTAHERFDVKFYLVGVLFLIFDIEVVFMMPWAVAFRQLDLFGLGILGGLIEMGVFVIILAVGYIYVVKRGALDWS